MRIPYEIYFLSLAGIHIINALVFLGILSTIPQYVYIWNVVIQVGLCLFLMYRYHPFRFQYKFEPIDAKLIFGSATLLFINVVSIPMLYKYMVKTIHIDPVSMLQDEFLELSEIPELRL